MQYWWCYQKGTGQIGLDYIRMLFSALLYTSLHFTTLLYTSLLCSTLYWTALHYTAPLCTTLNCPTMHYTTLPYSALHYTAILCTRLHCHTLHYTTLPHSALHYTPPNRITPPLVCSVRSDDTSQSPPLSPSYCPISKLLCTALHSTAVECTSCTFLHCRNVGNGTDRQTDKHTHRNGNSSLCL